MKYLLALIVISFTVNLCAQDTTTVYVNHLFAKKKRDKATHYKKIVETERGLWYTEIYQLNGTILQKGYYQTKNTKIKEGNFEMFYPTGDVREIGQYANNIKVGFWTSFYLTGEKDDYGKYNAEGVKDSIWVSLHKNGQLQSSGNYTHGEKTGEWLGYYDDGAKSYVNMYNETGNLHGVSVDYSKEGFVSDTGVYAQGDKVGVWKYFFNTGEPSGVVSYEDGEPITSEYWNIDGTVVDQKKQVVNQEPSFPGGDEKLYPYLSKNMVYPQVARDHNYQGRVYVSFVVENNGDISNVTILRGVHPSIDEESMRVIKEMPQWTPGISQNRKVRVRFNLPIVFALN